MDALLRSQVQLNNRYIMSAAPDIVLLHEREDFR